LDGTAFGEYQPLEGEIVFNNITNVIKTKTATGNNCAYFYPTCNVVQYSTVIPLDCFTPSLRAVCQFVDNREANSYKIYNNKAVFLANDTNLETWSITAQSGLYSIRLTVAQGTLPIGYWYINLDKYNNDTISNQYRIMTARDVNSLNAFKTFVN
jgi:hypothetical protein